MTIYCCFWALLVTGSLLSDNAWGLPASTYIDCITPRLYPFPSICEGQTGTLELLRIPPDALLILESPSCPICLSFLELSHTPGEVLATVNTTQPLDAESLTQYNGIVTYSIVCTNTGVRNNRTMQLKDINDNAPVFEKSVYDAQVSKSSTVGSVVVQVKAIDADVSPPFNTVYYSIEPPSDTFVVTSDGSVKLKTELNYAVTKCYTFNVIAKDIGNQSDTTVVNVTVDGPRFEHTVYHASVSNNKVGPIENIEPAPIKADAGNKSVFYDISAVHPSEYLSHFVINNKSGIITIQRKLNEDRASTVNLDIQASLESGSGKKANATATDPDVGETEMLQYSLVEPSTMFDIEPSSGQVYVVSNLHPGIVTLRVKATDQQGEYGTATVEVIIRDSSNVVQISINKPSDIVQNKVQEMVKALERALGLNVTILSVTDSGGNTVVSFIAMDTGGNVVPFEDVKNELIENKKEVNEALQAVFGADTVFDIVDEGKRTAISAIVGGVVGAVVAVAAIGAVVYWARQIQPGPKRRKSQCSMHDIMDFDKKRGSQSSMHDVVNFNK